MIASVSIDNLRCAFQSVHVARCDSTCNKLGEFACTVKIKVALFSEIFIGEWGELIMSDKVDLQLVSGGA